MIADPNALNPFEDFDLEESHEGELADSEVLIDLCHRHQAKQDAHATYIAAKSEYKQAKQTYAQTCSDFVRDLRAYDPSTNSDGPDPQLEELVETFNRSLIEYLTAKASKERAHMMLKLLGQVEEELFESLCLDRFEDNELDLSPTDVNP